MSLSLVGTMHLTTAVTAIVTGAAVLAMRKGTPRHRIVGIIYAASMLVINGSALTLYHFTGRPNLFHFFAVVNLVSLMLGLAALRRWRRTRSAADLRQHQLRMSMNYLGLMMAFFSELLVNPYFNLAPLDLRAHFWPLIGFGNLAMFVGGTFLIRRLLPPARLAARPA